MSGPALTDFVIVGLDCQKIDVDELLQKSYQCLFYYSPIRQQIPHYLSNLNAMCFVPPIHIYSSEMVPLQRNRPSDNHRLTKDIKSKDYIHQFVLTDSMGEKRYCTSLVVYEKIQVYSSCESDIDSMYKAQTETVYVPFSYCLISNISIMSTQKKIMLGLYKAFLDPQNVKVSLNKKRDRRRFLTMSLEKNSYLLSSKKRNEQIRKSDEGSFKRQLDLQLPTNENFEFILSLLFSIPENFQASKSIRLVITPQEQINRQEPIRIPLLTFHQFQSDIRLQLNDIDYEEIFKVLSIKNIVKIIQALILEKQIMIFTDQVWVLSAVCEALISFIQPFQWKCLYIPYLPIQMLETFHATIPYIIGIHSEQKAKVLGIVDYYDKIMVHLNEDRVVGPNQEFPEYLSNSLEEQLRGLKFNLDRPNQKVERVLFKHFIQMINNYIPYFVYSENGQDYKQLTEIFELDQYFQLFSPEDHIFYGEFQRTMIFSRFIEDSYKVLYETEFKKSMDLNSDTHLNHFMSQIKKLQTREYFNILEGNNNQSQIVDGDFKDRLRYYELNSDQIEDRECGEFYGIYHNDSKQGKNLQYPLVQFDKERILSISDIYAPVKIQIKPPTRQKSEFSFQKYAISNIAQVVAEEKKMMIKLPQMRFMNIQQSSKPQKYQVEVILLQFPQKIRQNSGKHLKSLFKHNSTQQFYQKPSIPKKENQKSAKKWALDFKPKKRYSEESERVDFNLDSFRRTSQYQCVQTDLYSKLFSDVPAPSQPTTPKKTEQLPKVFAKSTSKKIFMDSIKAFR